MKRTIITLASCLVAVGAYAQGYVGFANSAVSLIRTNDTTTTKASGSLAGDMGSGFRFELWYTPGRGAYDANNVAALTPMKLGAAPGTNLWVRANPNSATFAGRLSGIGTVTVPGTAVGDLITVQVRGWSASLGATWEEANAAAQGGAAFTGTQFIGMSALGVYKMQASTPAPATVMDNTTFGQQDRALLIKGFDLTPVPEPSTIALVGLGLAGLYFIRRRK